MQALVVLVTAVLALDEPTTHIRDKSDKGMGRVNLPKRLASTI